MLNYIKNTAFAFNEFVKCRFTIALFRTIVLALFFLVVGVAIILGLTVLKLFPGWAVLALAFLGLLWSMYRDTPANERTWV